ncbi:MAG: tetratricopeptide repeat protein [Promethearchaeota archaeon]
MENTPKSIKIHFAWIDYSIERRKTLRKNLLNATEAERLEIIKNFALYNSFLLKRVRNFVFSNLIYLNMLKDPDFKSKIKPKLYNIVSERFITEDELQELISSSALKVYPSLDIESQDSILRKFDLTGSDAVHYLKEKEKFFLEKGDLDGAMAARSLFKEYSPPGLLTLNDLFTDRFLVKYSIHPLKYDKFYLQYIFLTIKNFSLYNLPNKLKSLFFLPKLKNKFVEDLIIKLNQFIFDNLELIPSIELSIMYAPLINHLLSIASSMYFENLQLEDKLQMLNENLTIDMFIDRIKEIEIKENYNIWIQVATIFDKNGIPEFGLKIMKILEQKWMDYVKVEDKYLFFDTLATIYRNLQSYNKAFHYYKLAWKYIEYSKPYIIMSSIENLLKSKEKEREFYYSLEYRKGVCLKNLGEIYGHLNNHHKKIELFEKVVEIIEKIDKKVEKFSLYVNLAVAHRRLYEFKKEMDFLDLALDCKDDRISDDEINNIEYRIKEFEKTLLNKEKLKKLEFEKMVNLKLLNAKKLQNSFFFQDSIEFYLKGLNLIKKFNLKRDINEILKEIGFSYLYLYDWGKAEEFFRLSLEQKQDIEIKMYLIIVYLKLKKFQIARSFFNEIEEIFNVPPDFIYEKYYYWIIDLLNYLNEDELKQFIEFKELLNHNIKRYNFLTSIAIVLTNNGFSELGIKLFNESIKLIPKDKKDLISSNLNNIGTIHLEQDQYDEGIYFFKQALALNENCIPCLINMVNAYMHKLEFENAKKTQEELINLIKKLNFPKEQIEFNERIFEFINSLTEDILNINKVDIEEIRTFLLTAERLYLDYKDKEESFDASSIVLYLSKALERMLHDKISIHFNKLIKKYKNKYKNCSKDLKSFFGNLFRGRTISLGTWVKILNNIKNKELEADVKEFMDILCSKFDKKTFLIIANACNDLSTERNPLSHNKSLTIKEMIDLRKKIIKHLNQVIDLIF